MAILSRLQSLVSYSSLSNRAFALKCGIKQATFDKQVRGISTLSIDTIESILTNFPEVSAEWLMRGDGSMIKAGSTAPEVDRLTKLVDTITTLQGVINDKNDIISTLYNRIKQLEAQLK